LTLEFSATPFWPGEEGTPVAEICRKAGISPTTYFNWKKNYAGLLPTEMKRLTCRWTASCCRT